MALTVGDARSRGRYRTELIGPIIVIDELDGLKDRAPSPHAKWRAAYTLAFFDRIFAKPGAPGVPQQHAWRGTSGDWLGQGLLKA